MKEVLKEQLTWNRTAFFFVVALLISIGGHTISLILNPQENIGLQWAFNITGIVFTLLLLIYLLWIRKKKLDELKELVLDKKLEEKS